LQGYLIDVIDFIEPKFRRHGIFVEHSLDYSGDVFIDPNRFRRAIENICNNALDAMREGGTFQIETKVDDNRVKIAFIDQGCGMNDYVREHIFEEFFTFGKAHGTGLGLSIAKRIIEEHKGSIQVKSELGKGTTFIIDLPLS
jgi:signal transduction histidine kinase